MVSPNSAMIAPQQAGKAPIWSGSTTCCATTSPLAFISAQLASCDSRTMVEKPVRNSEFCISCTMPERLAFTTSRSTASMCINGASTCRVGKGAARTSSQARRCAPLPTRAIQHRSRLHLFSKLTCHLSRIATPVDRHVATCNVAMKAAIGPIADASHQAMLDRIVVNVVNVTFEVGVVADHMLPIAPLPNAFIALGGLAFRPHIGGGQLARESALDLAPSNWIVAVAWWQ